MDYTALYQQKLTTADEAVKVVKSGDWVDYGWCTGTPVALDKALAARMGELEDVKLPRRRTHAPTGGIRYSECSRQDHLELVAHVRH